jgi:hypothetical protein
MHALGEFERESGGNLDRAAELLERSLTLACAAEDRWFQIIILHSSGDVALAQGDCAHARSFYRDALGLSYEPKSTANMSGAVHCVAGLAAVAAFAVDTSRAGRLSGAWETLEAELGWHVLKHERKTCDAALAACSNADPIVFATAAEQGRRMSVEEIIAYALSDDG